MSPNCVWFLTVVTLVIVFGIPRGIVGVKASDSLWWETIDEFFGSLKGRSTGAERTPKNSRIKRQSPDIGDESTNSYEIRTSSLPTLSDGRTVNTRYMPTLGNGYLGTTVYSDSVYLNGLFNGVGIASHRARIPAIISTRINLTTPDFERRSTRKFTLNAQDGFFSEFIKCEFADIEHKIYVHQKYIRLYVVDIFVRMNPATLGGGTISMAYPQWNASEDIVFDAPRQYRGNWQVRGVTRENEAGGKGNQEVNIFYMLPLRQISISGSNREANYTMIMSIDKSEANARQEFDSAQQILQAPSPAKGNYDLFMEHVNEWRNTWGRGRVEVEGPDIQLNKVVRFAQFYILSSLPAESPALPPIFSDPFYGCGRTSIGRGGVVGKDYQGHVMWDNEVYIMPAVLPFHPGMAKNQLRYRGATMAAAAQNAARLGCPGIHFPWRSGFTGAELSPDAAQPSGPPPTNCTGGRGSRVFVTAGVLWAIRQYISLTRDRDFMINPIYKGCDLARESAKFLAALAQKSPADSRYDINGITGPDELHPNISNDIFTMCSVALGLHWERYFTCLCQRSEDERYLYDIAMQLRIPFDYTKRIHYQFKGFDPAIDRPIKQADAVMLIYPLNWNYSYDIMKNDLDLYEPLNEEETPALTWSWFTIGWKWVRETTKMRSYFLKSYQTYIIHPFKIWTENKERNAAEQDIGNVNFLPGMGGFLQSIVYGFAGIRIRPDILEVNNPMPPPGADRLLLYRFQYLQSNLTFIIEAQRTTIQVVSVAAAFPLILRRNQTSAVEESLKTGETVVINNPSEGFFIYTTVAETCQHPWDFTFMPYGYGPWPEELVPTPATYTAQFGPIWAIIVIVIVFSVGACTVYCVHYRRRQDTFEVKAPTFAEMQRRHEETNGKSEKK